MKKYGRAVLLGLASSLALSLSACSDQTSNASENYTKSQENIESTQTENGQLEQGLEETDETEKTYSYLDLFVLNTGKLGAEEPTFYIVILEGYYNTSMGETAYNCNIGYCYFAEENLKNKYQCYAGVYRTVGLEEEQTFYKSGHYPHDYYGENIYLAVNDYLFTLEPPGGTDYNASETELFQTFEDSIESFVSALKMDDLRESYTEAELVELMDRMNSGQFEFRKNYTQKLSNNK